MAKNHKCAYCATREATAASQNENTWINSIRFNGTRPIDNVRIKSLHIHVKTNQISKRFKRKKKTIWPIDAALR